MAKRLNKNKNLILMLIIMFAAVFSAATFLTLNHKNVYAETTNNNAEELLTYDDYTNSDYLLNSNNQTIFDYCSETSPLFATKARIQGSNKSYLNLIGNTDDDIVKIVPKSLFAIEGEELYVGDEYGFYINTSNREDSLFSTVLVFDIYTSTNLVETVDNVVLQVKPIFQYNYIYLFAENDSFKYIQDEINCNIVYSIEEDIVVAAPSWVTMIEGSDSIILNYSKYNKYYLKDISMGVALFNEQELNYGDVNYNPHNDIGSYITSYDYIFKGKKCENGLFFNLNETYVEAVLNKLNSAGSVIGWLKIIPVIEKIAKPASALLQAPSLIYSWFNDVESTLTANEALKSVSYVGDSVGKMMINSYYQNRDDQLAHYFDENNNPALVKSAVIPFTASADGGVWHGVDDYATGYFRVNHSALNEQANYTRVVKDITLKVMDSTDDSIKMFGTNTAHDLMRTPVYKPLKIAETNNINLLPNGNNYFKFNAQYESDYEITVPNANGIMLIVDETIINFVNNKASIKLSVGEHNIQIQNLNENEKLFSTIKIDANTMDAAEVNKIIAISSNKSYLLKINSLSQVKELKSNNGSVLISEIFVDNNFNNYVSKGNIYASTNISHPFISGDYYVLLQNNLSSEAVINFEVAEPLVVNLNTPLPINMNNNNYVYAKFTPTTSFNYVISAGAVENLDYNIIKNDSTLSNAGGINFSGYFYEVGFDANQTYFIGIKNNTTLSNTLVVNTSSVAYKWKISYDNSIYYTYGDSYELERGRTYTLDLVVNDSILTNMIYGYDNQSTAFGNYSISTNLNQITINNDCAVYGNGVIVLGRLIKENNEYINVDTIKIMPIFNETISAGGIVNGEDITFNTTATKYITKFEYRLMPYNNVFTYDIGHNNAIQNVSNSRTISILNNIKLLNNSAPENFTIRILKYYYINALNQELSTNKIIDVPTVINNMFAGGNGTANIPYIISTKRHFNYISGRNYYYKLISNLSLGQSYNPINEFRGTFDGNYCSITYNCEIYNAGAYGIWARNYGTIKKLIVDSYIYNEGYDGEWMYAGGICGINYGLIENCESRGTIMTERDKSQNGGIAGVNEGTIKYSTNYTPIYAVGDSGGIAGANYNNALVESCINNGGILYSVYKTNRSSGGIVGYHNSGNVYNCVNRGRITIGGSTSNSKSLNPAISQIVGERVNGNVSGNLCEGIVNNATLRTITWTTGIWPFKKNHSHNQAKYVSFEGQVGK